MIEYAKTLAFCHMLTVDYHSVSLFTCRKRRLVSGNSMDLYISRTSGIGELSVWKMKVRRYVVEWQSPVRCGCGTYVPK